MTDEQIIKALEIAKGALSDGDIDMETFTALNNAINFINRQKAENEELRSDKIIAERHEKDARELFVDCTRQLEEAKAEIENLKRGVTFTFTIEDFESIKETVISRLDNEIKSEAIKEFAERLKDKLLGMGTNTTYGKFKYGVVKSYEIDNLLKEMEGKAW
nr:MAG TPA: hypothetical protein [Caudoviricetes sp.]